MKYDKGDILIIIMLLIILFGVLFIVWSRPIFPNDGCWLERDSPTPNIKCINDLRPDHDKVSYNVYRIVYADSDELNETWMEIQRCNIVIDDKDLNYLDIDFMNDNYPEYCSEYKIEETYY